MKGPDQTRARLKKLFPTVGHAWLFARVAAWTALMPAFFRLLSLPRLMRLLTPEAAVAPVSEDRVARADLVCMYIMGVLNLDADNRRRGACLKRSLVLYRFARLAGLPVVFHVGVRREEGELRGHSWLELEGQHRWDPQAHVAFATTFSYPVPEAKAP